jgi:hypothetical protein
MIEMMLAGVGILLGWLFTFLYYRRAARDAVAQHREAMVSADDKYDRLVMHVANTVGRIEPGIEALLRAVEKIPDVKIARDSAGHPTGGLHMKDGSVRAIEGLRGELPSFNVADVKPAGKV